MSSDMTIHDLMNTIFHVILMFPMKIANRHNDVLNMCRISMTPHECHCISSPLTQQFGKRLSRQLKAIIALTYWSFESVVSGFPMNVMWKVCPLYYSIIILNGIIWVIATFDILIKKNVKVWWVIIFCGKKWNIRNKQLAKGPMVVYRTFVYVQTPPRT